MATQDLLSAEKVSAYVSNNPVPASELATLIATEAAAINRLSGRACAGRSDQKSGTNDYLISLADGKKLKSLKRARYCLTTDEGQVGFCLRLSKGRTRPFGCAFQTRQPDGTIFRSQTGAEAKARAQEG